MPTKKYAGLAKDYDAEWAAYNKATIAHTLSYLDSHKEMSVLDVGCGTGNMLRTLRDSEPTLKLSGLEPTAEMSAFAHEKLGPTVMLKQGFADHLPFADNSFDALLSNSMFHYIPQPAAFFAEARRVLKNDGQLIITDWCRDYWSVKMINLWLRLKGDNYREVYKMDDLARMMDKCHFPLAATERYKIDPFWGLMTLKATKA